MNIFLKRIFSIFVSTVFTLNLFGCATSLKIHPEFKERHKLIKDVSLMVPEIDAYILTFKGEKKRLYDLIPAMEETTTDVLEQIFSHKGYVVKELDLSEEVLKKDPELRTSLFHVNELFKKALIDIAKRKKKKFTYTLGSEVNIFADLADCDILIFVKEEGIKKSVGEIVKDVVKGCVLSAAFILVGAIYVPIPRTYATLAQIAVVDVNDGSVLWYNDNSRNINWNPEDQKQLSGLIRSLIKPFPKSVFSNEVKEEKMKSLLIDNMSEQKELEKSVSEGGLVPTP